MRNKEQHHDSLQKVNIIMVKTILLMTAGLLIICIILTQVLFRYLQYKSYDTQVIVYELEQEEK